jgi:TusA-related sulfurtransferase
MNSNLKNILIVFDAAGYNPVSMQTVIELAASWQAGIQALYVEDSNLLNAVELPFTREVSLRTAEITRIDSALIMQRLREDAENIKKQIEEIAVTRRVSLSFSSTRGQKTQVIRNCTEEVNMVLIPAVYSTSGRKDQHHLKHVVAMVYDNHKPSSETALSIAISQAAKNNDQLFVIVDNPQSKQHVEQLISQQSRYATCQIADFSNMDEVLLLLHRHSPGLLVLTEDSRLMNNEQVLQQLINSLESDILLVR